MELVVHPRVKTAFSLKELSLIDSINDIVSRLERQIDRISLKPNSISAIGSLLDVDNEHSVVSVVSKVFKNDLL